MSMQERKERAVRGTQRRSAPARHFGPFFAAIDLGTNNCRLMIATRTATGFRVIDNFNRSVGLGEGLKANGYLSNEAMARTLEALRTCVRRLEHWPLAQIRAVATEACRQARNGPEFLARVFQETGLRIDIISAREEAELAVESCVGLFRGRGQSAPTERGLLFDIGGGSTEIAWLRVGSSREKQTLVGTTSLPIGVISVEEMFGQGHGTSSYDNMVSYVREQLAPFETVHHIRREVLQGRTCLVGTSGTVTTLAGVALALPRYNRALIDGVTLSSDTMREAITTLRSLGRAGLAVHPCVGPERARHVLPGCAIFEAIHQVWPIENVIVGDRGLRDGLLSRMAHDAQRHVVGKRPAKTAAHPFKAYTSMPTVRSVSRYAVL